MAVRCDQYNQVCVLTIDGDLVADNVQQCRRIVDGQIEQHRIADFVLDLEKCPFIDSDGLEMLLWIKQRSEELFGQFKLVHAEEDCRKILEITRLAHRFESHNDLAAALKMMR